MGGEDGRERVRAVVHGLVQGVGFRWFVRDTAAELGLSGWVRNRPDGSVEFEAEGGRDSLERILLAVRSGPSHARVDRVETSWERSRGGPRRFEIVT